MTDKEKADLAADIGDEALDFDSAAERDALIEEECEGDPELARRVRDYLAGVKQVLETRNQSAARNKPLQRIAIRVVLHRQLAISSL